MTKKQRNEAYRFAYERIEFRWWSCICWELEEYRPDLFDRNFSRMVEEHYPELWLFSPGHDGFWFGHNDEGRNERLTCLAFCIAMTETKN